jgi:DNA modification methylase
VTPYYDDGHVVIYLGDCGEILPTLAGDLLVTDPPYPNNAGWFNDGIERARQVIAAERWREAVVFWTELEPPPVPLPPVAVHVWHRTNVNGRPYESAYQFAADARKRRSEVMAHPAIFDGAGPGCHEYLGHPTQKPVALMRRLIGKTTGPLVIDPFMGSGTTVRAAKDLGRRAIGIEIDERFCEIAARRLAQEVLDFGGAA